jgi:hypothetical protein
MRAEAYDEARDGPQGAEQAYAEPHAAAHSTPDGLAPIVRRFVEESPAQSAAHASPQSSQQGVPQSAPQSTSQGMPQSSPGSAGQTSVAAAAHISPQSAPHSAPQIAPQGMVQSAPGSAEQTAAGSAEQTAAATAAAAAAAAHTSPQSAPHSAPQIALQSAPGSSEQTAAAAADSQSRSERVVQPYAAREQRDTRAIQLEWNMQTDTDGHVLRRGAGNGLRDGDSMLACMDSIGLEAPFGGWGRPVSQPVSQPQRGRSPPPEGSPDAEQPPSDKDHSAVRAAPGRKAA